MIWSGGTPQVLECSGRRLVSGKLVSPPNCGVHFVKLSLDGEADSFGTALPVGYPTDVGRVKP